MTDNKAPAEVAAQVGTVEACWDSYRDNVVLTTVQAIGLPPNADEYVKGARLDYYAGAAAVFQILREMYEAGKPPTGRIMVTLEAEVAAFLVSTQMPEHEHKAGHA